MRREIQAYGNEREAGGPEHHDSQKTQAYTDSHGTSLEFSPSDALEWGFDCDEGLFWISHRLRLAPPTRQEMSMLQEQYVWLVWSSAFLAPWLAAYAAFRSEEQTSELQSLMSTSYAVFC